MNTEISDDQALEAVVAARPDTDQIDNAWYIGRREQVLNQVLAAPRAGQASVPTTPKRRVRWGLVAAAVALIAAIGLFAQAVIPYGEPGSPQVAQALDELAANVPEGPMIPDGSYELVTEKFSGLVQSNKGRESYKSKRSTWTDSDGWSWARQSGDEAAYYIFAPITQSIDLTDAPTDPVRMEAYLRDHVSGSSSVEEAMFVAVGDTLSYTPTPAATRAAAIKMLAELPGITVNKKAKDPAGRPATEITFVDKKNRPGETQSIYLDPDTTQLLGAQSTQDEEVWNTRIFTERRIVKQLPDDITEVLGTKRVEKEVEK